jgi:2-deoxy-D-gluconate 3-dehydrogenase
MNDIEKKFRLDGKVALVTGGAGLLGREFCRTLALSGAKVILADIDEGFTLEVAKDEFEGLSVLPTLVDVTDPATIENCFQSIDRDFGRIDILVNSAALDPKFDSAQAETHSVRFEDYPLDQWKQAIDVNLTGTLLMTQYSGRRMKEQGKGSIINICSTYGLVGPDQRIYPGEGDKKQFKPVYYSVTKAAVLGFTRYLASYYARTEIRVNALTPGGVYNNHEDDFVDAYSARTILGRMARKDEMNGALLFLASDASSYMTGANLVVDGGWTAW